MVDHCFHRLRWYGYYRITEKNEDGTFDVRGHGDDDYHYTAPETERSVAPDTLRRPLSAASLSAIQASLEAETRIATDREMNVGDAVIWFDKKIGRWTSKQWIPACTITKVHEDKSKFDIKYTYYFDHEYEEATESNIPASCLYFAPTADETMKIVRGLLSELLAIYESLKPLYQKLFEVEAQFIRSLQPEDVEPAVNESTNTDDASRPASDYQYNVGDVVSINYKGNGYLSHHWMITKIHGSSRMNVSSNEGEIEHDLYEYSFFNIRKHLNEKSRLNAAAILPRLDEKIARVTALQQEL